MSDIVLSRVVEGQFVFDDPVGPARATINPAPVPIRKRKNVSYRSGQSGTINVRSTKDGRKMARIRYWQDVPGQHARRRASSEWRDITDWTEAALKLWQTQVIARAGVHDPLKPIPSEEVFSVIANRWIDELLPRYKPSCRETMAMHVSRYLVPAFGTQAPEEITGPVVNKWLGSVRLQDGRAPSKSTLKHIVSTLQVILGRTFAKREIRYPANATPAKRVYCPTDTDVLSIIREATGVYRLLFALAASTGMRAGELYGLHLEDIDFTRGCIFVRQSLSLGQLQAPKTERSVRYITITPELTEAIREYAGTRTSGIVLLNSEGNPLHHANVLHRYLHPVLRALSLPQFGMHAFRHYSVSFCVRAGMSFDDVRMRHGHGSEEIMRRYLHLAPGHDRRILGQIPNLVPNVGPNDGPKATRVNLEPVAIAV